MARAHGARTSNVSVPPMSRVPRSQIVGPRRAQRATGVARRAGRALATWADRRARARRESVVSGSTAARAPTESHNLLTVSYTLLMSSLDVSRRPMTLHGTADRRSCVWRAHRRPWRTGHTPSPKEKKPERTARTVHASRPEADDIAIALDTMRSTCGRACILVRVNSHDVGAVGRASRAARCGDGRVSRA